MYSLADFVRYNPAEHTVKPGDVVLTWTKHSGYQFRPYEDGMRIVAVEDK